MHTKSVPTDFKKITGQYLLAATNGKDRVQGPCPIFSLLPLTAFDIHCKGSNSDEAKRPQNASKESTRMLNLPTDCTHGLPFAVCVMQSLVL